MVKVIDTKKHASHALKRVIPGGSKRSHILKSKPTPFSCRFFEVCMTFYTSGH